MYDCFLQLCAQLAEKSEHVFNASSTLTPDSMSDESQSRDGMLPETASGCSGSAISMADVAQKTAESDVCQFSNLSAEGIESCMQDNSTNKSECSDATESPQIHNRCMLSGIDVSVLNTDASISLDSADVSAVAELNDARLSLADSDSSVNSTLKGSDKEESSSEHNAVEINTSQHTFSVSIPISTMFGMETNKNKNADFPDTGAKSPVGRHTSKPVMQDYSPISDADEETPACQSPLHLPGTPVVNKRSARIAFSPISPFTPRPSASNTPLPTVPEHWSCDVSSSAPCDTSVWNTIATVAEFADIGKSRQHHLSVAPFSSPSSFTFTQQSSSYSHQSAFGHGNLVRPMQVNAPADYCQNSSFEHQRQYSSVYPQLLYQQPESRCPSTVSSEQRRLHSQQIYAHFTNAVGSSMSTHSSYSVRSRMQDATQLSSVEAGKYDAGMPHTVVLDSKTESHSFPVSQHHAARLVEEAKDVVSPCTVTSCYSVSSGDNFNTSQMHHNAAASTNFSSSNNG